MKKEKFISVVLAMSMLGTFIAGCSQKKEGEKAEGTPQVSSTPVVEKKPLKILMWYTAADPVADKAVVRIKEKTGWDVQYFLLPQQNADEKLMLEIASGTEYDALKIKPGSFTALASQGQLQDIGGLLDKYGTNIKKAASDMAWKASMSNGKIVGMPIESGADINKPYGLIQSGLAVRNDFMKELGLKLPGDIDSFTEFLRKIKAAKNIEPLTGLAAAPIVTPIASAFGFGGTAWCTVNDVMVSRVKMPGFVEYVKYMRQLYTEGLADKEWPINKQENVNQKLANGKAATAPAFFYEIPTLLPAIQKTKPDAQLEFITNLSDKNGKKYIGVSQGVSDGYVAVPKTSKNAEYVVRFYDKLSEPEMFVETYLGDKGVHYEVKDNKYYPILPEFDILQYAVQFVGFAEASYKFNLWQARARKTPEMAAAYESMNADIDNIKQFMRVDVSGYATGVDVVQKYKASLTKMETDFIIKAMASNEPVDKLYSEFIKEWDKQGGEETTKALNEWYKENKDAIK